MLLLVSLTRKISEISALSIVPKLSRTSAIRFSALLRFNMENGPLAVGTSVPKAGKRIRTDLLVPNQMPSPVELC